MELTLDWLDQIRSSCEPLADDAVGSGLYQLLHEEGQQRGILDGIAPRISRRLLAKDPFDINDLDDLDLSADALAAIADVVASDVEPEDRYDALAADVAVALDDAVVVRRMGNPSFSLVPEDADETGCPTRTRPTVRSGGRPFPIIPSESAFLRGIARARIDSIQYFVTLGTGIVEKSRFQDDGKAVFDLSIPRVSADIWIFLIPGPTFWTALAIAWLMGPIPPFGFTANTLLALLLFGTNWGAGWGFRATGEPLLASFSIWPELGHPDTYAWPDLAEQICPRFGLELTSDLDFEMFGGLDPLNALLGMILSALPERFTALQEAVRDAVLDLAGEIPAAAGISLPGRAAAFAGEHLESLQRRGGATDAESPSFRNNPGQPDSGWSYCAVRGRLSFPRGG